MSLSRERCKLSFEKQEIVMLVLLAENLSYFTLCVIVEAHL